MLENLLNSISDNPAYLAVAIVLITMITFSVIKKLFKIVTLGITLFILYCAYLWFTNQPLPNMDEIKIQLGALAQSYHVAAIGKSILTHHHRGREPVLRVGWEGL